ncbi:hypothetical protein ACWGKS_22495 [Nocardiopsis sp. NPDC055879]
MKCLDKRVLIGLGVLVLGVLVLAPQWWGPAFVIAVALVCPMSMLLMMRGMRGASSSAETTAAQEEELARLRTEVERLRVERGRTDGPVPPEKEH